MPSITKKHTIDRQAVDAAAASQLVGGHAAAAGVADNMSA
jgi:hypothetical protein